MQRNPYEPPRVIENRQADRDERLLRMLVMRLMELRAKSPTVGRLLFSRASLPLLAVVVGVPLVAVNAEIGMPREFCFLVSGLFLGAALRDFGWMIRIVRGWRIQEPLMDWAKIETCARELNI